MITKDFIKIFQQTAKEFGLIVNQDEVHEILAILEESLMRTGSLLDTDETLLIGRFIQLMKVSGSSKTGTILNGENKGKRYISAPSEYIDFKAGNGFKRKTKKKHGEMQIIED